MKEKVPVLVTLVRLGGEGMETASYKRVRRGGGKYLDTGDEHFHFGALVDEGRSFTVDSKRVLSLCGNKKYMSVSRQNGVRRGGIFFLPRLHSSDTATGRAASPTHEPKHDI